jgi:hypothetical protein
MSSDIFLKYCRHINWIAAKFSMPRDLDVIISGNKRVDLSLNIFKYLKRIKPIEGWFWRYRVRTCGV